MYTFQIFIHNNNQRVSLPQHFTETTYKYLSMPKLIYGLKVIIQLVNIYTGFNQWYTIRFWYWFLISFWATNSVGENNFPILVSSCRGVIFTTEAVMAAAVLSTFSLLGLPCPSYQHVPLDLCVFLLYLICKIALFNLPFSSLHTKGR